MPAAGPASLQPAILLLEDGRAFHGTGFGASSVRLRDFCLIPRRQDHIALILAGSAWLVDG